jgi:hypothetical protein
MAPSQASCVRLGGKLGGAILRCGQRSGGEMSSGHHLVTTEVPLSCISFHLLVLMMTSLLHLIGENGSGQESQEPLSPIKNSG